MNVAEKLTAVAENVPKVYEAGKQAEYDKFWDAYQQNGNRQSHAYAFAGIGWTDETFKPKYDMKPTYIANMFQGSQITDLQAALDAQGVELDTSQATGWVSVFNGSAITRIGALSCEIAASLNYTFANTSKLHTIEKLVVSRSTTYPNAFYAATALENIVFEGEIAIDLDMHWSNYLSADSLTSIVDNLANMHKYGEGIAITLTLGTLNQMKLTQEQIATITEKGWTLA